MTDTEQQHEASEFVRALLGDRDAALSRAWVTLWTWPDRQARWLPASDAGAIASAVAGLAATRGVDAVYIGIGLQGDPDEQTERHPQGRVKGKIGEDGRLRPTRGEAVDVIGLIGLATDVDIAGPAHTDKQSYPPDVAAARRVIDSMVLPPTLVIDSGHGLQPWWLFTEPLIFGQVGLDDDYAPVIDPEKVESDRADASDLLWSWTTTMRYNARSIGGWHIDPTGDIARVLRPAGSANKKIEGDPRRVVMLEHDPRRTYAPDDFAQYMLTPRVLQEMRLAGREETSGILEGVDVHAVWARVRSEAYEAHGYYPPWLRAVIEIDKDFGDGSSKIEDTFLGKRPDLMGDQSAFDASLTRLLADLDALDMEAIVEAVMCRRMRSGHKVDKIDPEHRRDYLEGTVGKFVFESERKREQVAARAVETSDEFDKAVAEARAEAATVPLPDVATPSVPVLSPVPPPPPDPPTAPPAVGRSTPGPTPQPELDLGLAQTPEPEPGPEPAPKAEPTPDDEPLHEPDDGRPEWNHVDDKARGDGGTGEITAVPSPPSDEETAALKKVTVLLALPKGFHIWRAEYRSGHKSDQMRTWVHRSADTDPVRGMDAWRPGGLAATKWHPKASWESGPDASGHLRRDLHVFCGIPAKRWLSEGLPLLYAVVHEVRTGTPREALRAAVRDLLSSHAPMERFSTARDSGHPWLLGDVPDATPVVTVPVALLRRHMVQMGESTAPTPEEVITMAAAMGCQVKLGVQAVEEHRTLRDARTWLTIAPGMLTEEEWKDVRQSIVDYKESQSAQNVTPIRQRSSAG